VSIKSITQLIFMLYFILWVKETTCFGR